MKALWLDKHARLGGGGGAQAGKRGLFWQAGAPVAAWGCNAQGKRWVIRV